MVFSLKRVIGYKDHLFGAGDIDLGGYPEPAIYKINTGDPSNDADKWAYTLEKHATPGSTPSG